MPITGHRYVKVVNTGPGMSHHGTSYTPRTPQQPASRSQAVAPAGHGAQAVPEAITQGRPQAWTTNVEKHYADRPVLDGSDSVAWVVGTDKRHSDRAFISRVSKRGNQQVSESIAVTSEGVIKTPQSRIPSSYRPIDVSSRSLTHAQRVIAATRFAHLPQPRSEDDVVYAGETDLNGVTEIMRRLYVGDAVMTNIIRFNQGR